MDRVFQDLVATCQCYSPETLLVCVCGNPERILRAYANGVALPPMTVEEREWCLNEIGSVEGWDRKDYEQVTDADLANGVMRAWVDYCRDKGML